MIHPVGSVVPVERVEQLAELAEPLRSPPRLPRGELLDVLDRWSGRITAGPAGAAPGAAFLSLWLRRPSLTEMVRRELGPDALDGAWRSQGGFRLRPWPVGVVGHWPAGNIEIQPMLSACCGLLGGNTCLVRVPSGLAQATGHLLAALGEADPSRRVFGRLAFAQFAHERDDLQRVMAGLVDGAMIWGGREAVSAVRSLPFRPHARLAVFGPRVSIALMDAATWTNPSARARACRHLVHDVWAFDQQACSSPQAVFVQTAAGVDRGLLIGELRRALEQRNRLGPRMVLPPHQAAAIARARADWMLSDRPGGGGCFPVSPDWTILSADGSDLPDPVQGRTLFVLWVDDLHQPLARLDGHVQTVGMAMANAAAEAELADVAAARGVDRIVPVGQMHLFGSPWDGQGLIGPMVRWVRHSPSAGPSAAGPTEEVR